MGELFDFENYEVAIAALGLVMLLAAWIPQLSLKRYVTLPFFHIAAGFLIFSFTDLSAFNPFEEDNRWVWEKLTELAVIISVFGGGLKIDEPIKWSSWKSTVRLLFITMPLTIMGVYFVGWWICGLPIASAMLLGAVIAPTDPVMAADVQVGPPQSGGKNRVRFPLTSEAGLNDSLAFPFTYFAICLAQYGWSGEPWLTDWFLKAVLYKIIVGALAGIGIGYVLSKIIFKYPTEKPLAKEGLGCIALSVLFIAYGGTELLGGYGFLAVFTCAIRLRRAVANHDYNNVLYEFSENLERCGMAVILFMLGGLAVALVPALDSYGIFLALLLIFVIRPVAGMIGLINMDQSLRERGVIAYFGIRGVGSIYYLIYAMGAANFAQMEWIWATVIFVIMLSSMVHGFAAFPMMNWLDRKEESN